MPGSCDLERGLETGAVCGGKVSALGSANQRAGAILGQRKRLESWQGSLNGNFVRVHNIALCRRAPVIDLAKPEFSEL